MNGLEGTLRIRVPTDAAMRDLGRRLAGVLRAGDLVLLSGPLGAGKTTLTQGLGEGLKVRGPIMKVQSRSSKRRVEAAWFSVRRIGAMENVRFENALQHRKAWRCG